MSGIPDAVPVGPALPPRDSTNAIVLSRLYADLLQREQQRARHAETLSEAALSLSSATSPTALLDELSRLAAELLGASGLTVYQVDLVRRQVWPMFIGGENTPAIDTAIRHGLGNAAFETSLLSGDEVFHSDVRTGPDVRAWEDQGLRFPAGVEAVARIPLVAEGRLRGVLALRFGDPQPFPEAERALLRDFATYAAIALRNVEQFQRERRARLLAESTTALSAVWLTSPDRDDYLRQSLDIIQQVIPSDGKAVAVRSMDGTSMRWMAASGSLASLSGTTCALPTHDIPRSADDLRAILGTPVPTGELQVIPLESSADLQGIFVSTAFPQASVPDSTEELRTLTAPLAVGVASMRLEEAVRERRGREQMMATALANMDQAVLIVGLDYRIRFANTAAIREYGYSADEFSDLTFDQLVDTAAAAKRVQRPEQGEQGVWFAEHVHSRHDGSRFPAAVLISYLRDGNDVTIGQVLTIRNLSEEQRIQQQLRQSEKLAALGELVAGVAHELNNPLAGISAFAQLLMEDTMPDEQHDSIRLIKREADRAVGVIRDLLLFSRKSGPTLAEVNVNEMVELTMRLRGYGLRSAGIDVRLDLDPELPRISGDAPRLQQVLLNLIVNAEHALQHAEAKRIAVRSSQTETTVVVTIADSGPGMDEDTRERIFEPFFTTKPAGEGTGLGLSVSYGIVRAHGGVLAVDSKPGQGATFRIELPIVVQRLAAAG